MESIGIQKERRQLTLAAIISTETGFALASAQNAFAVAVASTRTA
jgi:hypothetical protein